MYVKKARIVFIGCGFVVLSYCYNGGAYLVVLIGNNSLHLGLLRGPLLDLNLLVELEVVSLLLLREPPHARRPYHDLDRLVDPPEDVLLDIWDAMAVADLADERGTLLVGEHGELGVQVVFDLVVKPSVEEINDIGSVVEVHRGQNLPEVK